MLLWCLALTARKKVVVKHKYVYLIPDILISFVRKDLPISVHF